MPATLFRKACVDMLVRVEGNKVTIVHINDTCCLLPDIDDPLDEEGKPCPKSKDHKACRGGKICLHVIALLVRVRACALGGSTEAACPWTTPLKSQASFAYEPFLDTLISIFKDNFMENRHMFCPILPEDAAEIKKGIQPHTGNTKYRDAFTVYRDKSIQLDGSPRASLRSDVATGHGIFEAAYPAPPPPPPPPPPPHILIALPPPLTPATHPLSPPKTPQGPSAAPTTPATPAPVTPASVSTASTPKSRTSSGASTPASSTRKKAAITAVRRRHICVCPLQENCIGSNLFKIPMKHHDAWCVALGISAAPEFGRVSASHWPERALWTTDKGLQLAIDALPKPTPKAHDAAQLEFFNDEFHALRDKCPCGLDEERCGAGVTEFFNAPVSMDDKKAWLKAIRSNENGRGLKNSEILSFGFKVAKHHFAPDDIIINGITPRPRPGSRPTMSVQVTQPPKRAIRTDVELTARQAVPGMHLDDPKAFAAVVQVIEDSTAAVAELQESLNTDAAPKEDNRAILRLFVQQLKTSKEMCWRSTGERSFELLELKFAYLNALGALDRMRWWRSQAHDQEPARARRHKLSTFESYLLYRCTLREGPSPALEIMFGVHRTTARRTYITMLKACTFIMTHHFVWPSLDAARRATPSSTRTELLIAEDAAVFLGDATEREMESPRQPDVHCLVYSEYKSTTTLKHNGVAAGNGYLCEITRGYPGSTSDNKIHEVNDIGRRLAGDKSCSVVYLYDKGFTQLFNIEKYGVLVLTPRAKERFQLFFDDEAEQNKSVARNRVNIEIIFGNCRTYNAFSRMIDLDAIDIADLEADAVRCEVNMWPPMHEWTLTGEVTPLEDTRGPVAQQQREERVEVDKLLQEADEARRLEQERQKKDREDNERKERERREENAEKKERKRRAKIEKKEAKSEEKRRREAVREAEERAKEERRRDKVARREERKRKDEEKEERRAGRKRKKDGAERAAKVKKPKKGGTIEESDGEDVREQMRKASKLRREKLALDPAEQPRSAPAAARCLAFHPYQRGEGSVKKGRNR
jgi:hypothetical protein